MLSTIRSLLWRSLWLTCCLLVASRTHAGIGSAAVFTFQRDEHELLADWLQYHAAIFGANNVYVIDHSSTHAGVRSALADAASQGAHVARYRGPFRMKAGKLTQLIRRTLKSRPELDAAIPLDVDEFIVAQSGTNGSRGSYSANPGDIRRALSELPTDGFKYKFDNINAALCQRNDTSGAHPNRRVLSARYFSRPTFAINHKTFFHRKGFIFTDQGNHLGRVAADSLCAAMQNASIPTLRHDKGKCAHQTSLALVHFGVKGAVSSEAWKEKMERGAGEYQYTDESSCRGTGSHYCKALKRIHADGQKAASEGRSCRMSNFQYSSFIADAVHGDYAALLDFQAPGAEASQREQL